MSLKAVILAAGMGTRLGPIAAGKPKCLVEIGGLTLLERSLANLAHAGIDDVVVVLGFNADAIRRLVGTRYDGVRVTYVENPDYASTGNMYSLARAETLLDCATVILEADLIYPADVLVRLAATPVDDVIVVAPLLHHGDDVFVCADASGHVTDLGKHITRGDDVVGALLGISKFSRAFMRALFSRARTDFARGDVNFHYEETILATSRTGLPVHALVCPGIPWTEIDNVDDLERARSTVYPAIIARGNGDAGTR